MLNTEYSLSVFFGVTFTTRFTVRKGDTHGRVREVRRDCRVASFTKFLSICLGIGFRSIICDIHRLPCLSLKFNFYLQFLTSL